MRRNAHQMKYLNKKAMKWIDALESGEYKQCKGMLKEGTGFCCLGVACEIDDAVEWSEVHKRYIFDGESEFTELPEEYNKQLGLTSSFGESQGCILYKGEEVIEAESLLNLNDQEGFTFKQIARILRDTPENFFNLITEESK